MADGSTVLSTGAGVSSSSGNNGPRCWAASASSTGSCASLGVSSSVASVSSALAALLAAAPTLRAVMTLMAVRGLPRRGVNRPQPRLKRFLTRASGVSNGGGRSQGDSSASGAIEETRRERVVSKSPSKEVSSPSSSASSSSSEDDSASGVAAPDAGVHGRDHFKFRPPVLDGVLVPSPGVGLVFGGLGARLAW